MATTKQQSLWILLTGVVETEMHSYHVEQRYIYNDTFNSVISDFGSHMQCLQLSLKC